MNLCTYHLYIKREVGGRFESAAVVSPRFVTLAAERRLCCAVASRRFAVVAVAFCIS